MKRMVKVGQNHGWTECGPNDNCGPANGSSVVWVTETEEVVSVDTDPPFKGRLDGQNNVQGRIDGVSTFIKDKSQSIRFLNGKTIYDYRRCSRDFLFGVDLDPYRDVCKLVNEPFPDPQHLDWTQTAIIIMDVWDRHPSPGDAMRTDELGAPVEEFIKRARDKGALIIHSPSILGSRYDGSAALEKAINARNYTAGDPMWNRNPYYYLGHVPVNLFTEPFDWIVGGGGDWLPAGVIVPNQGQPTQQHPRIHIMDGDALSADGTNGSGNGNSFQEVLALTKDRPYLVYVGTATNWCVLRRHNGMRTMYKAGKSLWIVKDLTDAAVEGSASGLTDYAVTLTADQGPARKLQGLQLNHFRSTELIVDWIGWNLHACTETSDKAFPDLPRFWFMYDPDSPVEQAKAKYYIFNKKYTGYVPTAPISPNGNGYLQTPDENANRRPFGATVCQWTLTKIADAPESGFGYFEVLNVAHPALGLVGPDEVNATGGNNINTQPPFGRRNAGWRIPIDQNGNPLPATLFKLVNQKFPNFVMVPEDPYVKFREPTGADSEFWELNRVFEG